MHALAALAIGMLVFATPTAAQDPAADEPLRAARAARERGEAQVQARRYADAVRSFETAVAKMRAAYPDGDHADLGQAISDLGYVLGLAGRFDQALERHVEAEGIARVALGDDHESVTTEINNQGATLLRLGRPREAVDRFDEALRRSRERGDDEDLEFRAAALTNSGACLEALGDEEAALERHTEARRLADRLDTLDPGTRISIVNNVGTCCTRIGRLGEALVAYEDSLELARAAFDGDHPATARALRNTSFALIELRRFETALPRALEGLAMTDRIYGRDHPDLAHALLAVGAALFERYRYADALPYFEDAAAMNERMFGTEHARTASAFDQAGLCLTYLGRPEDGLRAHDRALAGWRAIAAKGLERDELAISLSMRSAALRGLRRYAPALEALDEALAIRGEHLGAAHRRTLRTTIDHARTLRRIGRVDEAFEAAQAALELVRRELPNDDSALSDALLSLGDAHRQAERWADARSTYLEAADAADRFGSINGAWLRAAAGNAALELGRADEAETLLAPAIAAYANRREQSRSLDVRDRMSFLARSRVTRPFAGLARAHLAQGDADSSFATIERGRAHGVLDLIERANHGVTTLDADDERTLSERRRRLGELGARRARLTSAGSRGDDDRERALRAIDAELVDARRALRSAERIAARNARHDAPLAEPASVDRIRAALDDDELLACYSLTDRSAVLYVVPPATDAAGAITAFPLTATRRDVRAATDAWLDAVRARSGTSTTSGERGGRRVRRDGGDASATARLGRTLFEHAVPDAAWQRLRRARRIWLVPDDVLHRVPFEALVVAPPTARATRYWLDDGPEIAYGSSASMLLACRQSLAAGRGIDKSVDVLAVGACRFDVERAKPPADRGVLLSRVTPGGAAHTAGLRARDVVLRWAGTEVADDARFRAIYRAWRADANGESAAVEYWRDGKVDTVTVARGRFGAGVARGTGGAAWARGAGLPATARVALRSNEPSASLAPLPGTAREVDAIRTTFAAAENATTRTLLGESATEAAVFEHAPNARILHLATHCIADEVEDTSGSTLAFTLPNDPLFDPENDGFLRLSELLSERWRGRLKGCELCVLSACSTSIGPMRRDEGLFAMPWGLLHAGVPAMVVTQWPVEDASTARLMADFYERLNEPGATGARDALTALTESRRALRAERDDPWSWAAFVYTGAP